MDNLNFNIRPATREDMATVYHLIKGLAVFEEMGNQVKITTETLIKDGFDTTPPSFSCLVAETSDFKIVGYAIYFVYYSTWVGKSINLEDLYVDPEYRRRGIGNRLFLSVAEVAHNLGERLDFRVLSWNPAAEFYIRMGAKNLTKDEDWEVYRLDKNSLKKLFTKLPNPN